MILDCNATTTITLAVSEQRWGTMFGYVSPQALTTVHILRLDVSASVVKLGGLVDPEVRT